MKANALLLVICLGVGLLFCLDIARALVSLAGNLQVISINPIDSFMALMETGMLAGLILYLPVALISIGYYAWDTLYRSEKKFMVKYTLLGVCLFIFGAIFGLVIYSQFCIPFFIQLNRSIGITPMWDYGNLLITMLSISLGTGLLFLFPIPLRIMIKKGLIDRKILAKQRWKVAAVLFGLIIICPFTPMDPFGQLIVFAPIYLLFEAAIFWT